MCGGSTGQAGCDSTYTVSLIICTPTRLCREYKYMLGRMASSFQSVRLSVHTVVYMVMSCLGAATRCHFLELSWLCLQVSCCRHERVFATVWCAFELRPGHGF